eukprot:CAMPEP_0185575764 /NCGR_PEP_ID=MMETSP0434-20130131/6861_1 /TAXON_ID=626734 ORGANISM="Favella taraikaensis, Strain Fe Narragansett Bay" /NCGR_SAMPLE_ID=MMETSP0434 /ASSEMBLY_ACC=CAM_ASM_000379 /LENGTH=196 /DNA_ID=CAMNT_0028192727 /DNA_START=121 /DNA_END=711 /DNA_ORIENTATION=+
MGIFVMYNNIVDEKSPDGNVKTRKLVTEIERLQNGVIRTNCIDCLDRTNVAQQMICLETLNRLVPEMGDPEDWTEAFIYLWAMSGDFISKAYSGTASVLTQVTLKGHQNTIDKVKHKMISLKRWTKQTLTDDFKQECIMILQGLDPSSQHTVVERFVNSRLTQEPKSFVKNVHKLMIQVATLNCAGKVPKDHTQII